MPTIDQQFNDPMQALSGKEKVARASAMLKWTREMIARDILANQGPMPEEQLRWHVALRLYQDDPETRKLIERKLADVSH